MARRKGLSRLFFTAEPEARAWVKALTEWRRAPWSPAPQIEFTDELACTAIYDDRHGFRFWTRAPTTLLVLGHEFAHYLTNPTRSAHGAVFESNLAAVYEWMGDRAGVRKSLGKAA